MTIAKKNNFGLLVLVVAFLAIIFFVVGSPLFAKPIYYEKGLAKKQVAGVGGLNQIASSTEIMASSTPVISHLSTPKAVKAIYWSSWIAGSKTLREPLIDLIDRTELNAVVIDVKDYSGAIAFPVEDPLLNQLGLIEKRITDLPELINRLHQKNIYVIARVSTFQDAYLSKKHPEWAVKRASDGAVWRDRKGISWLDVKAEPVWRYTVALAKEAYRQGFDEVNFDYIRFPSDGNMKDIAYPFYRSGESKADALEDFFRFLGREMRLAKIPTSADLFGMVCTNYDDLGIGQVLEKAAPHFDFIAPMVYPSHYPPGYMNMKKPATMPYEVINHNMKVAAERLETASSTRAKLRPWLQDFDLGADYTAGMINAQKKAVYDNGLDSWMMWDPSNKYTRGAYLPNN